MKLLLTFLFVFGIFSFSGNSTEMATSSSDLKLKQDSYNCFCYALNQEELAGGDNWEVFDNAYKFCMDAC